jgi:hypothetical protein
MNFMKKMIVMVSLITVVVCAKQIRQSSAPQRVPAKPAPQKQESVQPDISKLPIPLNVSPEEYFARNKANAMAQQLINDIFPKEGAIERFVFEFKDKFPGYHKDADVALLLDAIFYAPEVRKHITVKNTTSIYNFIKEALGKSWDKKNELIWAS